MGISNFYYKYILTYINIFLKNYNILRIIYSMYTVQCITHCTVYGVQCIIHYTVSALYYTLYSNHNVYCSIRYTVDIVLTFECILDCIFTHRLSEYCTDLFQESFTGGILPMGMTPCVSMDQKYRSCRFNQHFSNGFNGSMCY